MSGGARALCAGILLLIATGCATTQPPPLYYWGGYEDQIYTTHASPGALGLHDQIAALEADQARAGAEHRALPPGFRAHLGYLYAQDGRADAARAELLAEKAAFPESAVFVDRLVANLAAPPAVAP